MKFFVVFTVAVVFAAFAVAAPSAEEVEAEATALSSAEATDDEVVRAKKSTYGHHGGHESHGYGHHGGHHGGHGYGHHGGHHGGHGYAHAGPAKSYAYHSPAPHVPCGHNLLFGCHPSVAPVPCAAHHGYGHHHGGYGHHGY
ncbi:holotricin-3-like [Lutzomyia longipalpis]|uniref:holotricin-3-like n=1 Tax=Lutzomyia longipalpis TaxID=7200 RepID=UPI002483F9A8|nr:holotricin-3-like [Lutzomyia longipalpis]